MRAWIYEKGIGWLFIIIGLILGILAVFGDVLIAGRPSIVVGIMAKLGFLIASGLFILGIDYIRFWRRG